MRQRNKLPVLAAVAGLVWMAALVWLGRGEAAWAQGTTDADVGKPRPAAARYTATPVDGLPSDMVWTIAFDEADRPWVGTNGGGASRQNDGTWQWWTEQEGLGGEGVNAWLFPPDGTVWVGTDRSLDVFADGEKVAQYGWADGMASSGVQDLALDHDGNIWAAHLAEGVSRFDGEQWRKYTTDDGLADNWVYSIAVDDEGKLWFGTGAGVSVFDGADWTNYTTADGLAGEWVSAVAVARDGTLWFATDGGVSEFDGRTWTTHLADRQARTVAVAPDGAVWAAGGGFVSKWDGAAWTEVQPAYFANQLPIALAPRINGEVWVGTLQDGATILTPRTEDATAYPTDRTLWLGTADGVTALTGDDQQRFNTFDGLAADDVRSALVDSQGRRCFGTSGGASMYDGFGWTSYYPSFSGISSNYVHKVAIDPQGRAWLAYGDRGLGLSVQDGDRWQRHTAEDGLVDERVYSIAFGPEGETWVGTEAGVRRLNGNRWVGFPLQSGAPEGKIEALALSPSGEMWAGFTGGVAVYDGRFWTTFGAENGLTVGTVRAIVFNEDGHLWLGAAPSRPGAEDGGLFFYDGDGWTAFAMNRSNQAYSGPAADPSGDWVNDLAIDQAGQLWVGTLQYPLSKPMWVVGGVSVYTGDVVADISQDVGWMNFTTDNGLISDYVTALALETDGRAWVGTRQGVSTFDGEQWRSFTAEDGLPSLDITDLAVDGDGGLWVTTWGGGAAYYDGAEWLYLTPEGVADREVNALAEDQDGAIWFATAGGVSRFDGEEWTVYTTRDGLADNDSRALTVDGEGNVWVGGGAGKFEGDGLSRFDGEQWTTYTLRGDVTYSNVAALAVDAEGGVWAVGWDQQQFSAASALFHFDGEQWQQVGGPSPLGDDRVYAFAIDDDGTMWFGTDGSYDSPTLITWDGQEWGRVQVDEANSPVYAIALTDEGGYLGTHSGLAQLSRGEDGEPVVTWDPLRRTIPVRAVAIEQADTAAESSSEEGAGGESAPASVWRLREELGGGFTLLAAGDGQSVWALAEDRLVRADGDTAQSFDLPADLIARVAANWSVAFPTLTDLAVDARANPWISTREDGLYTLEDGDWRHETTADGLPADTVIKLAFDGSGQPWAVFEDGGQRTLAYRSGDEWVDVTPSGLPSYVRGLAAAGDTIWLASGGSAPYRWQAGSWEKVIDNWDGSTFDVSAAANRQGDVWFGNDDGWLTWTAEGWQAPPGSIAVPFAFPVAVDVQGGAWGIVTPFCYWCKLPNLNENGVIYATLDGACRFTAADGLGRGPLDPAPDPFNPAIARPDAVRDIAVGADGVVWFVTNGELTTFTPPAEGPICR